MVAGGGWCVVAGGGWCVVVVSDDYWDKDDLVNMSFMSNMSNMSTSNFFSRCPSI